MFDGVSTGAASFSTHESLLVIGVGFISADTGLYCDRLLAAPSSGYGHDGPAYRDLVLRTLDKEPFRMDLRVLRSVLTMVGGDGAVVKGGDQARHRSTKAANLLWQRVFPDVKFESVDWDLFHRFDISGRRAVTQPPAPTEVFDVARVMSSLFGVGSGRVIVRGVAEALGVATLRVASFGGTRKIVYLSRITHNLLFNFPVYHGAMWVRS